MINSSPNYIKFQAWNDKEDRLFEILDIKSDDESMKEYTFSENIQCFDMDDQPLSEQTVNNYHLMIGESYDEGYFWTILRMLAWSSGYNASDLNQDHDEKTRTSEIYTKSYTNK